MDKENYAGLLMPLAIHENLLVQGKQINISGHTYTEQKLAKYDQQKVTAREFEDVFMLYDQNFIYITLINKQVTNV